MSSNSVWLTEAAQENYLHFLGSVLKKYIISFHLLPQWLQKFTLNSAFDKNTQIQYERRYQCLTNICKTRLMLFFKVEIWALKQLKGLAYLRRLCSA